MADYAELQGRIGYTFKDGSLLQTALTHPSVAHSVGPQAQTNQRLEFLGDAVLQLVLSRELFLRFPEFSEGPLTKTRAGFVNRRVLAEHARTLGLGPCLIVSRGEEDQGGRDRASALADTFEALLGAIFLDGGFEPAREFVLRLVEASFADLAARSLLENPKGELQEILQAKSIEAPHYRIVSVTGPDHDRLFECTVHHGNTELARGRGKSKKAAETDAAMLALRVFRGEIPPSGSPPCLADEAPGSPSNTAEGLPA